MPQTETANRTTTSHPITSLGETVAYSIRHEDANSRPIKIPNIPKTYALIAGDFVATNYPQTLRDKTLLAPIIASLKQASDGGIINMPTVASGSTATLATTTDIPTNMVSTDGAQTITGQKTLTTPVIASLQQSSTGGIINVPEVEAGETATLITTANFPNNVLTTDNSMIVSNKVYTNPVIKGTITNRVIGRDVTNNYELTLPGQNGTLALTEDRFDGTIVRTGGSQTITGPKTIINPNLRDSTTEYNLTVPTLTADDVIATVDGTQTLTNKTLTTPVIFNNSSYFQSSTIKLWWYYQHAYCCKWFNSNLSNNIRYDFCYR